MAITADILVTPPPIAVAVSPPQPRPVIAPAGERDGAGHQRRESARKENDPLSFRAALSAATFTEIARASIGTDTAGWGDDGKSRRVREARLPDSGPVELTGAEASDLFARAVANNARQSRAPAFAAATSLYAASYFAGSSFSARPGGTLEITA